MSAFNQRLVRYLARHPAALARYQANGAMPETRRVASPLIELLEGLGERRRAFQGILLGPALGYKTVQRQFPDGQHLLDYLKPFEDALPGDWCPGLDLLIPDLGRTLSEQDLAKASHKHPVAKKEAVPTTP